MTGYFRSLARRASGQGGWIRPVLAPIVVPEAAPLVEIAEEATAAADPVEDRRPGAVELDRPRVEAPRIEATAEAVPAPEEVRSNRPSSELVRSLWARRLESPAEEAAVRVAPVRPLQLIDAPRTVDPQRAISGVQSAASVRPPLLAPLPEETQHRRGIAAASEPGFDLALPAPALIATARRESAQPARPGHSAAELAARAPEEPVRFARTASETPRARPPRPPPSPDLTAIPAPRPGGQVVQVTIGRVEVRAPAPPTPPAPRPPPRQAPMMSLADYLRERGGRR